MRLLVGLTASLMLVSNAVSASPLLYPATAASPSVLTLIHHKPGHHGGPPWARRRDDWRDRDRDDWRDRDDRRDRDRYERQRYSRRTVTECRTRYEERFDPYRGVYVRRPVQVCRGGEGLGYGFGYR